MLAVRRRDRVDFYILYVSDILSWAWYSHLQRNPEKRIWNKKYWKFCERELVIVLWNDFAVFLYHFWYSKPTIYIGVPCLLRWKPNMPNWINNTWKYAHEMRINSQFMNTRMGWLTENLILLLHCISLFVGSFSFILLLRYSICADGALGIDKGWIRLMLSLVFCSTHHCLCSCVLLHE